MLIVSCKILWLTIVSIPCNPQASPDNYTGTSSGRQRSSYRRMHISISPCYTNLQFYKWWSVYTSSRSVLWMQWNCMHTYVYVMMDLSLQFHFHSLIKNARCRTCPHCWGNARRYVFCGYMPNTRTQLVKGVPILKPLPLSTLHINIIVIQ